MRNSNTLKVLIFTRDISNNPENRNPTGSLRPIGFLLHAYLPEHYKNPIGSMRKKLEVSIWDDLSPIRFFHPL
jgi:hypothetical protein